MGIKLASSIMAMAIFVAGPASAQESASNARQLPGKLDGSSPKSDGNAYRVHTMPLVAGKRYAFNADSDDFDATLRLSLADDNDEMISEDDDSGEGSNAYLELVPSTNAVYRIRVSALGEKTGKYVLKISELPPLPPLIRPTATSTSTMVFKNYVGELKATDAEVRGRRVDDYVFRFEGGKQVQIGMDKVSEGLDPLLEIYAASDRLGNDSLARDDDSGDEMNAFVTFVPEQTGEYIVRATSVGEEQVLGSYKLRVGQLP